MRLADSFNAWFDTLSRQQKRIVDCVIIAGVIVVIGLAVGLPEKLIGG